MKMIQGKVALGAREQTSMKRGCQEFTSGSLLGALKQAQCDAPVTNWDISHSHIAVFSCLLGLKKISNCLLYSLNTNN